MLALKTSALLPAFIIAYQFLKYKTLFCKQRIFFSHPKERKAGKTALFQDTFAQKALFCAKVRIMLDLSEFSWYTMRENR